jgi:nickel/cobalt transporter (NicO) family protein
VKRPVFLISLVLLFSGAFAHPMDECLQATYLKLGPDSLELELDLTPGERVAPQLLGLIDQNKNSLLDQSEVQRYGETVLEDLSVNVDDQPQILRLEPVVPPPTDVFLAGGGTIKLVARANLTDAAGSHSLGFRNNHAPVKSGYLANVFVQSGEVKVLEQKRDATQQEFRVRYNLEPRASRIDWVWLIPAILVPSALITLWLTRTKRRTHEIAPH